MRIRKRNILTFLIILLLANKVLLSINKIDSLEKNYNYFNDKDKITAFLALSDYYERISVNKSIYYAESALNLSKKIKNYEGEIQANLDLTKSKFILGKNDSGFSSAQNAFDISQKCHIKKYLPTYYKILGYKHSELSNYSKSLYYYNLGLKMSHEFNNWETEGLIYKEIGQLYLKWNNFSAALSNFNNSYEIFNRNNSKINSATIKGFLGYTYFKMANEKKSFENFNQAIDIDKQYGYYKNLAIVYEFIGYYYNDKKDFKTAVKYFINSKDIIISINDNQLSGEIFTKIAYCYSMIGEYKTSLEYNFKALFYRMNYGDRVYIGSSYNNIGTDYLKMNKLDSSEKYFKKGLESAIGTNNLDFQIYSYKNLSFIFEKTGYYKTSLEYYKNYDAISDSTYSISKYRQILEYQSKLDYEHQKTEISKYELTRQKTILLYILIIACIFIILVIVISLLYFSKQRDNKRLDEKSKELKLALEELNSNKEELSMLNLALEERVVERTKELNIEIEQRKLAEENLMLLNNELEDAYEKSEIAFKREKELNILKTNFIQMISHEFRTPLTVISSSSEIIKSYLQFGQIDKVDKMINTIISSVNEISTFIEDVFMYNRLEEHGLKPVFNKIDLSSLCNKLIDEYNKKKIYNRNISFIDNNLKVFIQSDISFLQQILNRLIKNAIKFSPDNSSISLELIKDVDNIKLIINDNGWGINPNEQKYIFNAFHREGKYIGIIPGIGLGLAIVKRLVEIMAWTIEYESELNKGTSFSITIPIEN